MTSNLKNSLLLRTVTAFMLFVCLSSNAYSQLESVNVEIIFTVETDSVNLDSLGGHQIIDVMNVNVTIDDIDFMGEVIVTVYDDQTNYPLSKLKMTAQQFIDANLKVGSIVTVKLDGQNPTGSYRVETQVRNFQGGNFPMVITNYNI